MIEAMLLFILILIINYIWSEKFISIFQGHINFKEGNNADNINKIQNNVAKSSNFEMQKKNNLHLKTKLDQQTIDDISVLNSKIDTKFESSIIQNNSTIANIIKTPVKENKSFISENFIERENILKQIQIYP
ncbi:MAG: hypothetical protein K8S23_14785 [Candidatus Cloacimonetes bacterium]|nr:hypothetical protein [Candidatus Cloacimonadota bacterium]